jgi:predicted chitinase
MGVQGAATKASAPARPKTSVPKPAPAIGKPKASAPRQAAVKSTARPAAKCDAFESAKGSSAPAPEKSHHVTPEKLTKIAPGLDCQKAKEMTPHVNAALDEFKIDTPKKVAAFLGNSGVETAGFTKLKEDASGKAYEPGTGPGKNVGNTQKGDGPRFKGRGGMHLTGRANYTDASKALGMGDYLVKYPEAVECPNVAWRTAGWHWSKNGNNERAENGDFGGTVRTTQGQANGKYTNRPQRDAYYRRAMEAYGEKVPPGATLQAVQPQRARRPEQK